VLAESGATAQRPRLWQEWVTRAHREVSRIELSIAFIPRVRAPQCDGKPEDIAESQLCAASGRQPADLLAQYIDRTLRENSGEK
jgi:hypothetical protein